MRRFVPVLVAAFLLPVASAAPVPKALKRSGDEARIVGEWEETPGAQSVWLFRADGTAGVGDPANPACKAVYKIDPSQTPKHLDWSQDGGKTWFLAAYELDGDTLKISFGGGNNGVRPPSAEKGNGFQFVGASRRGKDK